MVLWNSYKKQRFMIQQIIQNTEIKKLWSLPITNSLIKKTIKRKSQVSLSKNLKIIWINQKFFIFLKKAFIVEYYNFNSNIIRPQISNRFSNDFENEVVLK